MITARRMEPWILVVAMAFPTVLTWTYFVWLSSYATGIQQSVYLAGKALQFALPLLWTVAILRERIPWSAPRTTGMITSAAFGMLVFVAMWGLYHGVLKNGPWFAGPAEVAREKIAGLGLNSLPAYIAVGVFYSLCHSGLEEYYWRWFIFGRMQTRTGEVTAIVVSSLAFMAHHVVLLATYFGWSSPITYLFSFGVGFGGAVWALIYSRSQSLYGPWLSHCLVDAAIFLVGYDLARDILVR